MINITTTLLIFTLFFTACAERGSTLTPKNVEQKPILKKTFVCTIKPSKKRKIIQKKEKLNIISPKKIQIITVTKVDTIVIKSTKDTLKKNVSTVDNSLFSFSDDTKNKISGFFIFVIGLMIIL